jgi:hypothetical protein
VDQIDDLAWICALLDDGEEDDRKRSCDDLNRWKAATTRGARGLEVERRVGWRRCLKVERLANHGGVSSD